MSNFKQAIMTIYTNKIKNIFSNKKTIKIKSKYLIKINKIV